MRRLFNSKYYVSRNHVRYLLCFSFKNNLVTISHAFLYNNMQFFRILNNFFSLAMRTIRRSNLTSAATSIASCLHLHLHPHSHLYPLHNYSLTITFRAYFCFSILRSCASTFRTIHISCYCHFSFSAYIKFFQANMNFCFSIRTSLPIISSSIEKFINQIIIHTFLVSQVLLSLVNHIPIFYLGLREFRKLY